MVIGTSPIEPGLGFGNPGTIDVARASTNDGYRGYMANDLYVSAIFENAPSANNCWRWNVVPQEYRYLCGGDLDDPYDGGDPDDEYAVIEICQEEIFSALKNPIIFLDDISIAIY